MDASNPHAGIPCKLDRIVSAQFNFLTAIIFPFAAGEAAVEVCQTIPPSGSFIDGFEGQENISLYCEVAVDGQRHVTAWTLQTAEDLTGGYAPGGISYQDEQFLLEGERISYQGFNLCLCTNLTIVRLSAELDGSIIYCGADTDLQAAQFFLRTYSEYLLTITLLVMFSLSLFSFVFTLSRVPKSL